MAQRSGQRQPVYSADSLALRYVGGLALIALGIMMLLAVGLGMAGAIFDRLREVCFGLTGALALVLPALPVWAGVLVIWSSQKKAPVRPLVYAALAFLALCAFIVTVTRIGSEEYLAELSRASDGSWGGVIYQGYVRSIALRQSGGALGVALAYPFWSLTGTVLSAVLLFAAVAVCVLLALNLTPRRIRDLASGRVSLRSGRNRAEKEELDQRQIAFQQEQERQRQEAYARQQAALLQQQQAQAQAAAMAARQASGKWARPGGNAGAQQSWPAAGAAAEASGVREWQQQLMGRGPAGEPGRKSQIFDREPQEAPRQAARKSAIFDGPETAAGAQPARKSQIFGRSAPGAETFAAEAAGAREPSRLSQIFGRKEQGDGLSELSEEEKRREGMSYPGSGRARNQNASRQRQEMEAVEEDLNRWRRPPEEETETPETGRGIPGAGRNPRATAEASPEGEISGSGRRTAEEPVPPAPRARTAAEAAGRENPERKPASPWMAQVLAAEQAAQESGEEAGKSNAERRAEKPKPAERKVPDPVQITIPAVQETIANPTWKPELKMVQPKEKKEEEEYWEPTPYYAPPITDLKKPDQQNLDTSREDAERSVRLEQTLASFQVQARVVHVTHGPAISRFELELASGTKVSKVAGLEKDIAYGMQATSVRIEAPIPGKSLVGVEVPNPTRSTVTLREILESPQMQNAKSILTVALGKDIAGVPVVCDLAKMPHMLIAGATGSGKSVCINTIINSLLFRAGPEDVKLILVDPKVVELQCYNGIPHLLLPVVNDPHKAAAALAWAVAEMMERYDKFAERGVRNLDGYNGILEAGEKPMPRIVIIIDELADLMMVCKKDVEEYICRLTQLARAAGIHLIVATQRPSVDVITGLIKANIPSRIAFKTAQSVDSRTILDRNGSEQLLGMGDMLYLPTGAFSPTRVQGCFLSDEEVNRIADHVRQANPSTYDPDILDRLEQLAKGSEDGPGMDLVGGAPESTEVDADLFSQAVEYAIADGQISTSTLQRRLKVGYARAGRLTDEMEERGIISAKDGSKPRKCLITREEWEAIRASARGAAAEG